MKKIVPLFFVVTILSCSVFFSQSLNDVVQPVDNFSLQRMVKENKIATTDRLLSGDASLFVEFGADTCLVAEYTRDGEKYTVEAVLFLNSRGSLGAFIINDLSGSYPVELGDQARKSDTLLQFVKGNYIISVLPSRSGSMPGAQDLALALEKRIKKTGIKPDIYGALPKSSIMEESKLFFMGPKVFRKRFPADLSDVLGVENAREGVAAKYRTDDGIVDFIKIRYASPEQAREALNSYLRSQADRPVILPRESLQYYTVVEPDRSEVYIANYAEWVYIMPGNPYGNKGLALFEYVLRGGK